MPRPIPRIKPERCTSCGSCVRICPAGALALDNAGRIRLNLSLCYRCLACVDACLQGAISRARVNGL